MGSKENVAKSSQLLQAIRQAADNDDKEGLNKALQEAEAHQQRLVDEVNNPGRQQQADQSSGQTSAQRK